jgi:hypothetical protein
MKNVVRNANWMLSTKSSKSTLAGLSLSLLVPACGGVGENGTAGQRHDALEVVPLGPGEAVLDDPPTNPNPGPIPSTLCLQPLSGSFSTQLYGGSFIDQAKAVATDMDKCAIYSGGQYWPNAAVHHATLRRTSTAGVLVWEATLGGASFDEITSLAVDSEHNVIATGFTYSWLPLSPIGPQGGRDVFVAKYTSDGVHSWTRQLGTSASDTGMDVAITDNDDIIVVGETSGQLPLAAAHLGGEDIFIARFDSAGNHLWTKQHGDALDQSASGVAIGPVGSLYVVGGSEVPAANHGLDLFIGRYRDDGTSIWTDLRSTPQTDYALDVAINENSQVFLTGYTDGSLDGNVNHGDLDIVVVGYEANGTWRWTDQRGTDLDDMGLGISLTEQGGPMTVGYTEAALDGNVHLGDLDLFVMRHGKAGAWYWTRQYGTSDLDLAMGIAHAGSSAYMVGYSYGDLGGETNQGESDSYVLKLDDAGWLQ